MITYYNNFDKFKHILYASLLDIDEDNKTTTVLPQFFEQCQFTFNIEINQILGSRAESVINLQQVGVANAATN
ncbi:MAG: hypothetical protein HeimC2_44450 [Candidatus Heimdallarchaeota archaeon LC_2]|nr:MAG: hypothetical protein HeimC2_44450 [Candidatus Heimdallarchaeota archaeon LC_2]